MKEQRKHPVCMMKGCDQLQARELQLEPAKPPEGAVNADLFDTSPFYVRVCEKHAQQIMRGGYQDVSVSAEGE